MTRPVTPEVAGSSPVAPVDGKPRKRGAFKRPKLFVGSAPCLARNRCGTPIGTTASSTTNIGEGLNIFRYTGTETRGAVHFGHLNPQTQEVTLP
jgi:hypothetical protein